jgi:hypothetical protein
VVKIPRFGFCLGWVLLAAAPLPAQTAQHPSKSSSGERCGPVENQVLSCPRFGFSYKVPFGWVDRTAELGERDEPADSDASGQSASQTLASSAGSVTLLAVFERPPGAPGDTINSAAVVAAEPLGNYPGLKTAADYFGPLSELAEQRGFKVVHEPYWFAIGSKQLVRGEFSKARGKLAMWQSSLVMIEKGYVVSFTFLGGSEDELEELIGALSFRARTPSVPAHK